MLDPTAEPLTALADQCVQCGLCLPVCPTYALAPLETESPRGRITLAKALAAGTMPLSEIANQHLDNCLGCRRCEAVCPAGVRYGAILEGVRQIQRVQRPPGWRQRAIEALTAHPKRLRWVMSVYRWLALLLPPAWRPLPRPPAPPASIAPPLSVLTDAAPETVALFSGCIARAYDAPVHAALQRLCAAVGAHLAVPPAQTCCGSLHAHAGDHVRAKALAANNRLAFAPMGTVLSIASGCQDAVAQALRDQNTVQDAFVFLAARRSRLSFHARTERIALHLPCTQRSVSKSDTALLTLLHMVPDLDVVPLDAGHGCCGAAGSQMLTDLARAQTYRAPLLAQLATSGATRLLSANIGCRLHLANGTHVPVQHPLEFLAECLP